MSSVTDGVFQNTTALSLHVSILDKHIVLEKADGYKQTK